MNVVACAVAVNAVTAAAAAAAVVAAAAAAVVVFIFVSCFSTCCSYALLTFNDDSDLRHLYMDSQS